MMLVDADAIKAQLIRQLELAAFAALAAIGTALRYPASIAAAVARGALMCAVMLSLAAASAHMRPLYADQAWRRPLNLLNYALGIFVAAFLTAYSALTLTPGI